jgi:hypothetical protein
VACVTHGVEYGLRRNFLHKNGPLQTIQVYSLHCLCCESPYERAEVRKMFSKPIKLRTWVPPALPSLLLTSLTLEALPGLCARH